MSQAMSQPTPENPYAIADKIVTDYCRRLGFESLDDVGSLQHAIAAAIRAAEERAREESWCAGMAYAKSADPDCLQHLSGKVIDCTGPEPRVLPMVKLTRREKFAIYGAIAWGACLAIALSLIWPMEHRWGYVLFASIMGGAGLPAMFYGLWGRL